MGDTRMMNIVVNGEDFELPERASVRDLVLMMRKGEQAVAVEVNGALVPRARHESHQLLAGDRVEVVSLVGGG